MRPASTHSWRYTISLTALLILFGIGKAAHPCILAEEIPAPLAGFDTPSGDSTLQFELFNYPDHRVGLPVPWEARKGAWGKASPTDIYYTIKQEDGNQYLSAETEAAAINAGRPADINLRIYNKLRWRWRVWSLPIGANEEEKSKNDSGAAIRIVFKGGLRARMLKYVWSSTLHKGTETESAGNSKIKVVVLQSGTGLLGQWVWEEVNAYEDYKRLFGGEPRTVQILGVITDANNTKTLSKADYDDFSFIQLPEPVEEDDDKFEP